MPVTVHTFSPSSTWVRRCSKGAERWLLSHSQRVCECARGQKDGRGWTRRVSQLERGRQFVGQVASLSALSIRYQPLNWLTEVRAVWCAGRTPPRCLFVCAQAQKQLGSNHSRCLLTQKESVYYVMVRRVRLLPSKCENVLRGNDLICPQKNRV